MKRFTCFNNTATLLLICLLGMAVAHGSAESFEQTYQNYQDAVQAKKWQLTLPLAGHALIEGLKTFDIRGENISNLRLNFARELIRNKRYGDAIEQLRLALESKSKTHGPRSPEIIKVLMALGKSTALLGAVDAAGFFRRAIEISTGTELAGLEEKMKLEAGLLLARVGDSKQALKHLEDAHLFYTRRFGFEDVRGGLAGLNLGQIYFENQEIQKARDILRTTLVAFSSAATATSQFNSATRKLLINVLEVSDQRAEATKHCLALAVNRAKDGNASVELIYAGRATAPPMLAVTESNTIEPTHYGGIVVIIHDVDEQGFATNPIVLSETSDAANATAINVLRTRRYSPGLAQGLPVTTKGLTYRYSLASNAEYREN